MLCTCSLVEAELLSAMGVAAAGGEEPVIHLTTKLMESKEAAIITETFRFDAVFLYSEILKCLSQYAKFESCSVFENTYLDMCKNHLANL